jgi:hypothetical protein
MSNKNVSQSMAASLMTFSQTLLFAAGIQLSDYITGKFNYSAFSFATCCLIAGICSLILTRKFALRNVERQWN